MALSQIQCLDDNHVNPRTHESKPEFFYCEDQRLALETLLRDGREAFAKYLEARGVRGFLSDLELEALSGLVEPYDPGIDLFPEGAEGDPVPLSLHYWPDLSDTSIPQMDLGWPDAGAYRGVTRTTVYTQPPLEGQVHIKEVVRKMITQAQKVIAVVMDVFTDVDIFRDLIDVSFKKKVSVYILLERRNLPHFLSMCRRANMHTGHLKHLRVRCTAGAEFYTRSCTKVSGRMGHRFMFVDGDKAVSGSYSFTWMSSRLDRNLITVTTGQAVEGFDQLYRFLYASSNAVDLRQVATELEPEPEPAPQPVVVAPPSAAVARKLYNPKYALVAATNPSPTTSAGRESPKEPVTLEDPKQKRRRRASEEDGPPLHPGLVDLEKAYLIPYLPTWPEPDPPSDVIGFINIRDARKPMQVHLQRSEMFETSQAIKFSSPFSKPEATLPKTATPRQLTVRYDEVDKPQPAQNKANTKELEMAKTENKPKAKELVPDKVQPAQLSVTPGVTKSKEKAPETILPASAQKSQPDTIRTPATDNKVSNTSNDPYTASNKVRGSETPHLSAHTDLHSSSQTPSPNRGTASNVKQTVSRNRPQSELFPESNTSKKTEPVPGFEGVAANRAHTLESNSKQVSQLTANSNSNSKVDTPQKTVVSRTDSHTQPLCMQPERVPASSAAVRSHFHFENNHIPVTKVHSNATASPSVSTTSPSSPLATPSFKTQNPQLPSSSSSASASPVPKPRTVQLLIKDDSSSSSSQVCFVKKPETTTEPAVVHNEPPGQAATPVKETVQDNRPSKVGAQTHTDHTRHPKETPHHKESMTFQQIKVKEADGRLDAKVRTQLPTEKTLETQSNDLSNAASVKTQEIISKYINRKHLKSADYEITPKTETDSGPAEQTNKKVQEKVPTSPEFVTSTNKKAENVTTSKTHYARAHEPQVISYYRLTPQDIGAFDVANSSKDSIQTPVSPSHSLHLSKDSSRSSSTLTFAADNISERGKQAISTPANNKDSVLNAAPQNTHSTFQEQSPKTGGGARSPEKSLRSQLSDKHVPEPQTLSPERELRSIVSPVRTPTLDRFSPRTSSPDPRTPTPDSRSYTPDFRTPTPDISDGYLSTREDSNLSTTSEEYYECSDSPVHEPAFEHTLFQNHATTEDPVVLSNANAISPSSSPLSLNYHVAAGTGDRSVFLSETQTLARPARGSSSSFLGKRVKTGMSEDTASEENGKGEDEKVRKPSVAGRKAERESLETDRRDGEEAGRVADRLKQEEDSTNTAEKAKDPWVPKQKKALIQSATDSPVDRGTAAGESTNEETELTRLSSGDLKPERVTSEGEEPDKVPSGREKVSNQVALRSRAVVRREKLQSSSEAEEQKRVQQQDGGSPSSSRPPRPPRPLSGSQYMGARPWGSRPLNQTESKVLEVLEGSPSPRKAPSRPPPPAAAGPAGPAVGRRPAPQSQQGVASRQPPAAAQGRTRASHAQSQTPHQRPQPQSQVVSALEAREREDEKGPFSFTFSKLYNLKGLKDRMNKVPAQGKKGSGSSPAEGRKSTS